MCVVMIYILVFLITLLISLHTLQSPDWDSRGRSITAPVDPASYSSLGSLSMSSYSFSSSSSSLPHPVLQVADLPPLPGEYTEGAAPPPLPKRGEMDDSGLYPPPLPRKGHTLPRKIIKNRTVFRDLKSKVLIGFSGGANIPLSPLPKRIKVYYYTMTSSYMYVCIAILPTSISLLLPSCGPCIMYPSTMCMFMSFVFFSFFSGASVHRVNGHDCTDGVDDGEKPPPLPVKKKHIAM